MAYVDEFIDAEVPSVERIAFPQAFFRAYEAVRQLIKETPFLQHPPAQIASGHLIAWGVDHAIVGFIESGQWRVEGYDWAPFQRPTGKYLRVFTKRAVVTISQLPDTYEQPRGADFRANGAYDPQQQLFLLPGEITLESAKRPHLLLIHGYHELNFIHLAMPNPEKSPAWLGISRNMLREIHDVSTNLTPPEGPKLISPLTIKEQLKKQIRDYGA